jgi:choline dehydrogenase
VEFIEDAVRSGRKNLLVFTNSTAMRVVFDERKVATSVLVRSAGDGQLFELRARQEIILSAGAMHTPQLLMLSGIGPAGTLKSLGIPVIKDLPGVGQNLQDHPVFQIAYEASAVTGSTLLDPVTHAAAVEEYNTRGTGLMTHNQVDHFAFSKVPATQLSSVAQADLATLPADWPHYAVVVGNLPWTQPGNFVQGVIQLQAVTSRGTVSLASANISDSPVINPRTMATGTDEELAIGAFRMARSFFNTTSLRKITGADVRPGIGVETVWSDAEILDWLRENITPGLHGCCTASMGKASDRNAVVDSRARVFGVRDLGSWMLPPCPFCRQEIRWGRCVRV